MPGKYIPKGTFPKVKKKLKPLMEKEGSRVIDSVRVPEEEFLYILRLHAEFVKPERIQESLQSKYGQNSALGNSLIRIKHVIGDTNSRLIIAQFRGAYLNRIKDVPIANKRVRLEDLEEVRDKVITDLKQNKLLDAEQKMEFRLMAKSLKDTLDCAREEVEGKSIVFNQLNVIGDFGDKSDDELASRRDELIRKASRVIATEAFNGRTVRVDGITEGTDESQGGESS